jgi:preprotein translocase subunit SecD
MKTLSLLLLLFGALFLRQERGPAEPPTLLVGVDCARARELVWTLEGASDEDVRAAAARVVEKRLRALGRSPSVTIDHGKSQLAIQLAIALDPHEKDLLEGLLRSLGLCEFFVVLEAQNAAQLGIDLAGEREKLAAWSEKNPGRPLEAFNVLPAPDGPDVRVSWVTLDPDSIVKADKLLGWPVLLPGEPEDLFGAASFARSYPTTDVRNAPAIGFELKPERTEAFAAFTERNIGRLLAIVVGGKLVSSPRLETQLLGHGVVSGRFDQARAENWLQAFADLTGPLRLVEIR